MNPLARIRMAVEGQPERDDRVLVTAMPAGGPTVAGKRYPSFDTFQFSLDICLFGISHPSFVAVKTSVKSVSNAGSVHSGGRTAKVLEESNVKVLVLHSMPAENGASFELAIGMTSRKFMILFVTQSE